MVGGGEEGQGQGQRQTVRSIIHRKQKEDFDTGVHYIPDDSLHFTDC